MPSPDPGIARERDNQALEELMTADGALVRALKAVPNSIHSAFGPFDIQEIERCHRYIQVVLAGVEAGHRAADEKAKDPDADH